jgi:phosphoenolpyruvate carboxylase
MGFSHQAHTQDGRQTPLPHRHLPSVYQALLLRQIAHYLSRIHISERFKEWAIKYLHELHEKESTSRDDIIRSQQAAYRNCIHQIDNLVKLKTAPGNTDGSQLFDEEYGRQRVELLKDKAKIEEMLRDAGHRVEQWLDLSEKTFKFVSTAQTRFAQGDAKTKKEILLTIGSNLTLKDKRLNIEAKKPFLILEMSLPGHETSNRPIEPENTALSQGCNDANQPPCLRLLADLALQQNTKSGFSQINIRLLSRLHRHAV